MALRGSSYLLGTQYPSTPEVWTRFETRYMSLTPSINSQLYQHHRPCPDASLHNYCTSCQSSIWATRSDVSSSCSARASSRLPHLKQSHSISFLSSRQSPSIMSFYIRRCSSSVKRCCPSIILPARMLLKARRSALASLKQQPRSMALEDCETMGLKMGLPPMEYGRYQSSTSFMESYNTWLKQCWNRRLPSLMPRQMAEPLAIRDLDRLMKTWVPMMNLESAPSSPQLGLRSLSRSSLKNSLRLYPSGCLITESVSSAQLLLMKPISSSIKSQIESAQQLQSFSLQASLMFRKSSSSGPASFICRGSQGSPSASTQGSSRSSRLTFSSSCRPIKPVQSTSTASCFVYSAFCQGIVSSTILSYSFQASFNLSLFYQCGSDSVNFCFPFQTTCSVWAGTSDNNYAGGSGDCTVLWLMKSLSLQVFLEPDDCSLALKNYSAVYSACFYRGCSSLALSSWLLLMIWSSRMSIFFLTLESLIELFELLSSSSTTRPDRSSFTLASRSCSRVWAAGGASDLRDLRMRYSTRSTPRNFLLEELSQLTCWHMSSMFWKVLQLSSWKLALLRSLRYQGLAGTAPVAGVTIIPRALSISPQSIDFEPERILIRASQRRRSSSLIRSIYCWRLSSPLGTRSESEVCSSLSMVRLLTCFSGSCRKLVSSIEKHGRMGPFLSTVSFSCLVLYLSYCSSRSNEISVFIRHSCFFFLPELLSFVQCQSDLRCSQLLRSLLLLRSSPNRLVRLPKSASSSTRCILSAFFFLGLSFLGSFSLDLSLLEALRRGTGWQLSRSSARGMRWVSRQLRLAETRSRGMVSPGTIFFLRKGDFFV